MIVIQRAQKDLIVTLKENVSARNTLLETNVSYVQKNTAHIQNVTGVKAITMDIRSIWIARPVIALVVEVKVCNVIKKLENVSVMKTLLVRNVTNAKKDIMGTLNVKVISKPTVLLYTS